MASSEPYHDQYYDEVKNEFITEEYNTEETELEQIKQENEFIKKEEDADFTDNLIVASSESSDVGSNENLLSFVADDIREENVQDNRVSYIVENRKITNKKQKNTVIRTSELLNQIPVKNSTLANVRHSEESIRRNCIVEPNQAKELVSIRDEYKFSKTESLKPILINGLLKGFKKTKDMEKFTRKYFRRLSRSRQHSNSDTTVKHSITKDTTNSEDKCETDDLQKIQSNNILNKKLMDTYKCEVRLVDICRTNGLGKIRNRDIPNQHPIDISYRESRPEVESVGSQEIKDLQRDNISKETTNSVNHKNYNYKPMRLPLKESVKCLNSRFRKDTGVSEVSKVSSKYLTATKILEMPRLKETTNLNSYRNKNRVINNIPMPLPLKEIVKRPVSRTRNKSNFQELLKTSFAHKRKSEDFVTERNINEGFKIQKINENNHNSNCEMPENIQTNGVSKISAAEYQFRRVLNGESNVNGRSLILKDSEILMTITPVQSKNSDGTSDSEQGTNINQTMEPRNEINECHVTNNDVVLPVSTASCEKSIFNSESSENEMNNSVLVEEIHEIQDDDELMNENNEELEDKNKEELEDKNKDLKYEINSTDSFNMQIIIILKNTVRKLITSKVSENTLFNAVNIIHLIIEQISDCCYNFRLNNQARRRFENIKMGGLSETNELTNLIKFAEELQVPEEESDRKVTEINQIIDLTKDLTNPECDDANKNQHGTNINRNSTSDIANAPNETYMPPFTVEEIETKYDDVPNLDEFVNENTDKFKMEDLLKLESYSNYQSDIKDIMKQHYIILLLKNACEKVTSKRSMSSSDSSNILSNFKHGMMNSYSFCLNNDENTKSETAETKEDTETSISQQLEGNASESTDNNCVIIDLTNDLESDI